VPLVRRDGTSFGVLCALDPRPSSSLTDETLVVFRLLASLIAYELEADDNRRSDEEALRLAREEATARERLLGVLGHDLRTPLTSIMLGAAAILQDGDDADTRNRTAVTIAGSARRAGRMITDLLDFTRARLGGGIPVRPATTDLALVCRKVVREVAAAAAPRRIEVVAEGSAHGMWDADRAAQVISNLLSNALQYSPQDTSVTVTLAEREEGVILSVCNRGEKIPPSVAGVLFSPFRRGNASGNSGNRDGLGLGLYIVGEIMRAHGGSVTVCSDDDQTCFSTVWPRKALEVDPASRRAVDR
jgi:signal transduction histidine kinase